MPVRWKQFLSLLCTYTVHGNWYAELVMETITGKWIQKIHCAVALWKNGFTEQYIT